MRIYPTIELKDGRPVSLKGGRIDEAPHIWHVDPVERACAFAEAGADWMHITDFDALGGDTQNRDLIIRIMREAGIPVQLGGGMRTRDTVAEWIDLGVGRAVISTLAVQAPDAVKELAKLYPDQIVLSVDVWEGQVLCDGWRTTSAFAPADFIAAFDEDPLAAIVVTDVDADLAEADASLALVTKLADGARAPIIASGLIRSLDDIARLKYVPRISGAILGRALFDKSIALEDALEVAQRNPERTAAFI